MKSATGLITNEFHVFGNWKAFRLKLLLPLLILSIASASCSGPVKYHLGLVTMRITGKITPSLPKSPPAFILVKKYQRTFIETSEGYLYREAISVSLPDPLGHYNIPMESGTDKLELQFIIPGSVIASNTFHRTLGVGSMEFDVIAKPNPDWKNSYFLFLKPMLSEYISNKAIDITPADQLFIGNWMQSVEESLAR